MRIFSKNNPNRPRPTAVGALAVLAILVLIGSAVKCVKDTKSEAEIRDEVAALDLYYGWDGKYVKDDVGDAEYVERIPVDNLGLYLNRSIDSLATIRFFVDEVDAFVILDKDKKKARIEEIREGIRTMESGAGRIDSTALEARRMAADWMARLQDGDSLMTELYRQERTRVMSEYAAAEKREGELIVYDVRFLRSGTKMRLVFAHDDLADTLALVTGKRIY